MTTRIKIESPLDLTAARELTLVTNPHVLSSYARGDGGRRRGSSMPMGTCAFAADDELVSVNGHGLLAESAAVINAMAAGYVLGATRVEARFLSYDAAIGDGDVVRVGAGSSNAAPPWAHALFATDAFDRWARDVVLVVGAPAVTGLDLLTDAVDEGRALAVKCAADVWKAYATGNVTYVRGLMP